MITYHHDNTVTIRGYSRTPVKLTFRAWLNVTDKAVAAVEDAMQRGVKIERDATENELNAKRWLFACWEHQVRTAESAPKLSALLADWKTRRHLFDIAPDPSRIIRCQCCNIPLRDPVSKLLGVGPVCRTGGKKQQPRSARSALQIAQGVTA
ncbi:MAG: hypothetical protein FJ009_05105 [Chloroflexi bacterium]|nr:hypothetical protein [Chloroflexota bacterium]